MAEYIEREALIADIEKRYCRPCEAEGKDYNHVRCRACWVDDMLGEIGDAPFYDVVPVVNGRWKERFNMVGRLVWDCSECDTTSLEHGLYCPYCGARMKDGE